MARRVDWTRYQLLVALRLYMRTPFGRLHRNNPEIIDLAQEIGRTPSALSMKACNFASLDPTLRARNISGLSGASEADRRIWAEFQGNAEELAAEAEEAFSRLHAAPEATETETPPLALPTGETEVTRLTRTRRVQSFFRAAVLISYERRCAVSGLAVPELLNASHIIPWSESVPRRADPTNGICLNALFDRAFDRGLISFDVELRIIVSLHLVRQIEEVALRCSLDAIAGRSLRLPNRFAPDVAALAYHREHVFRA